MSTMTKTTPQPAADDQTSAATTLKSAFNDYVARIRGGDVGSLPAVFGLIVLVTVFSILKPQSFTNSFNFANLLNQSAGVIVLAMGLVFVLLLGEIDLSAGYTAATGAAILGYLMVDKDWPVVPAVLACLASGAVIGLGIGLLVSRLGIPSFVVTLAAFLALQGVVIKILGEGGSFSYSNEFLVNLNTAPLSVTTGWVLTVIGLAAYAAVTYLKNARRRARGLVHQPVLLWAIKTGALAVLVVAAVAYLSVERSRNPAFTSLKGVPQVLLLIVALLVVLSFLLSSTPWGRHVYAVGGNSEAARRAGINVAWIKLSCFLMCSTLAAVAGILIASRDNGVSGDTGGSQTLLFAVGAAVIGGTSLFGGKGKVSDAVIGGLVISVIANGMPLLQATPATVLIVTGFVLLIAASVDAISRQRSAATGRA
ncbi:ABC transporter permease [Nocardioides sp. C4-1]|uniref:sugar ABC transporter permease n=1 Tax=Nocardioides sp. C4-1 TaxID=3151851 RepID=UPI0032679D9D